VTEPTKPPLPKLDKEPSKAFEDAFRDHIGTSDATCELCGRHVFGGTGTLGYELGELEGLRAKAEKDPDRYVEVPYDGVSLGRIEGKQTVLGCPCNRLRMYEDWVWGHRRQIIEYLKKRIKERLEDAETEAESIGELKIEETYPGGRAPRQID
jgi:hypothetical protein